MRRPLLSRARRVAAVALAAAVAAPLSLPARIDAAAFDISTIAGTGVAGYSGDGGQAIAAQLSLPSGLAFDTSGNLFVSSYGSHVVRKIAPDGIIATVAGTGTAGSSGDGGPATAAQLNAPADLAFDASGNLYVADHGGHRVRRITPGGIISTVAGTGTAGYSGDDGQATSAMLSGPVGLDIDGSGALHIADMGNHRVRRVSPTGTITTVAGNGTGGKTGDGGPASAAKLKNPRGLAIDSAGALYISEFGNDVVRKVTPAGDLDHCG